MKLSKPFGVPLLFPVFFPYESAIRIAKVSDPICIRAYILNIVQQIFNVNCFLIN